MHHTKDIVYGASLNTSRTSQYELELDLAGNRAQGNSSLRLVGSAPNCGNQTSAYVVAASQRAPFNVYGVAWPGPGACGTSFSTSLSSPTTRATWAYGEESGVHGLALAFDDTVLYSADLKGDSIWTHRIIDSKEEDTDDEANGDGQVEQVGRLRVRDGSGPRHLAVHPAERYLHVVMETANELVTFDLDADTGEPRSQVSVHSVIPDVTSPPPGLNASAYWAAEVALSPSGRYLWASSRARGSADLGYLSVFQLDDRGAVEDRLFMVPTTTRGGIANSVSPAPWSDEFVAMTDYGTGYVQIWKVMSGNAEANATATAVARVDIVDGGCCANVIWYD
ncbi:hypothetical protein SLS62_005225 [Diatrype stigma]|uniref:3-carboxy-cis,cis-mucoante lactonizing enzyme n=1 Tax=Diatrype stigma TaxID=117547 RepID=A0AAN9YNQ1_9PEZI